MSARHLLLPATAVLFGLTACTAAPAPAPETAAPTSAAPTSAAPTSAAPTSAAPVSAGCPSAKELEKLYDLPEGWSFVPSSVECWKNWATAASEGPSQGDGIYLFQYRAGTGWKYHSQGSGYLCEDLGIDEPAPFCGQN